MRFASGLLLSVIFVSTSGSFDSRVGVRTRVGVTRVDIFNEIEEFSIAFLKEMIKVVKNRFSTVLELIIGEDEEGSEFQGNGIW